MSNYYIRNRETGKLEMHFDKETYMALPDDKKREIKQNFLFSRRSGAWVSRCKFPNLHRAEELARKLGLENHGVEGKKLSFEEQQNRKAARAEARAERFDGYSENAEKRGEALQKPINDRHGDIAFFTQPNINSSAGRAFTNRRNKMFEAWERGFEEFKKSAYYEERAEIARQTAASAKKPESKAFCERRIAEAEKTIKKQKKNIEHYKNLLADIEAGKGDHDAETVNGWIERAEEIIEDAISKALYYHEWIEKDGGIQYSMENIKPGYVVDVGYMKSVRVASTGSKFFKIDGCNASFRYSEITKVISTVLEDKIIHPFVVGDKFVGEYFDFSECKYLPIDVEVTKVTPQKVSVRVGNGRATSYNVTTYDYKSFHIPVKSLKNWITKTV